MKLGTLLNEVVTKSGGDVNDPILTTLFATLEKEGLEVPDAISKGVQENLYTYESALANQRVRQTIRGELFSGIDAALENDAKELQLSDVDILELKAEKNSIKRARLLAEKAKAIEAKKHEAKTGKEAELIKQNEELHKNLSDQIKERQQEKAAMFAAHENDLLNYEIANHLTSYSYIPALKDMPAEVRIKTAQLLLNQELLTKGLKVTKSDGILKLLKNDGTEYFDAKHQKVEFPNFAKLVLDTNKLLEVSKPADQNGKTVPVIIPGNDQKKVNQSLVSSIDDSLADITASNGMAQ